jgi:surface polysaccharide O-acyltransferase-like enzyme
MRITVPFVVFLPLLTVMMIVAIGWAMGNVESKSPMLAMVAALVDNPDAPKPPPSTMHLWFLYYLMIFYFLTAVFIKINRFNLVSWVSGWISKEPLRFILHAPLCLVPAMLMSGVPYPSPEQFTPKVWACWFFGCFFFLGWVFNRHGKVVEQFRPYWKFMLLAVLVLYPVFVYLIPDESITIEQAMATMVESREITVNLVALSFLGAYIALYTTLFLLVLGKDFFNRKSAVVRLISDSSYWIYLIHLPVVFAIQFALMDVDWPLWVELFISALVTFAVGMLSYLVFVRWTPVGWMLNGRKKQASS